MRSILFRADANPAIGIGDLMSLITLSEYFDSNEWQCYFMIRAYPASVKLSERIDKNNLTVIDSNASIESEVIQINSFCKKRCIDLLLIEITERPLSEYSSLDTSIKKACINFNSNLLSDLSLVVNWDVDARKYMKQNDAPDAKFLLGPEYVILPKVFYNLKQRIYKARSETILIAMGGADEHNLTSDIISCLIENKTELNLNIIVGSGYQHIDQLKKTLEKSNLKWKIKHNVKSMLEEYLECDVAIGAGGLTASELVASKTPAILIATYEHQIARCQYFEHKGYVKYLGFRDFDSKELINEINHLKILNGKNIFNTQKVVDEIKNVPEN